jgi:DNA polymerase-4
VSIKVRSSDFTTVTRARTLREPTDVARVVYDTACGLWEALGKSGTLIRLVGVRVEGLADASDTPHQLTLAGEDDDWRAAENAADRASARFGRGAVRPAVLVERESSVRTPRTDSSGSGGRR